MSPKVTRFKSIKASVRHLMTVLVLRWILFPLDLAASPPTSGLKTWLDANNGVTVDGSNGVVTWSDESNHSNCPGWESG
jgi:hypothetical protein